LVCGLSSAGLGLLLCRWTDWLPLLDSTSIGARPSWKVFFLPFGDCSGEKQTLREPFASSGLPGELCEAWPASCGRILRSEAGPSSRAQTSTLPDRIR